MSETNQTGSGASPFGIPGAAGIQQMFEAMSRSWNLSAMPQFSPTLDPDELDRRIADLNTVAQWLAVNQGMLQAAIQTLQMQRTTLQAMRSFGEGVAGFDGAAFPGAPVDPPASNDRPAAHARAAADQGSRHTATGDRAADDEAPLGMPPLDPQAWWAALRNQFEEVAATALDAMAVPPAPAAAGRRRKPAGRGGAAKPAGTTPDETGLSRCPRAGRRHRTTRIQAARGAGGR